MKSVHSQVIAIVPSAALQNTEDWADITLKANDLVVVKPKAIRSEQLLALADLALEELVLMEKSPGEYEESALAAAAAAGVEEVAEYEAEEDEAEINEFGQPPFVRLN